MESPVVLYCSHIVACLCAHHLSGEVVSAPFQTIADMGTCKDSCWLQS